MITNWKISRTDLDLLMLVVYRIEKLRPNLFPRTDLVMDLNAVHSNACPLDFAAMLTCPDFDLLHDVYGIYNHFNRETGEMMDCFLPRLAKR